MHKTYFWKVFIQTSSRQSLCMWVNRYLCCFIGTDWSPCVSSSPLGSVTVKRGRRSGLLLLQMLLMPQQDYSRHNIEDLPTHSRCLCCFVSHSPHPVDLMWLLYYDYLTCPWNRFLFLLTQSDRDLSGGNIYAYMCVLVHMEAANYILIMSSAVPFECDTLILTHHLTVCVPLLH